MLHFVGFRSDCEYWSARRIWGRPDFIHLHHDHRMYGDIDDDYDVVVYGSKGSLTPCQFSDQDHERH